MFKQIIIQSEYNGAREKNQIWRWCCLNKLSVIIAHESSKLLKDENFLSSSVIIGTVEWMEAILGFNPKPNYFPDFLVDYFNMPICLARTSDLIREFPCFLKPADRYKRFDSRIFHSYMDADSVEGPYWIQPVIWGGFENEWRYYIAHGKILASEWYKGSDESLKAPEFPVDIPSGYCGAIDMGITQGKLLLIEAHDPYACGWYGDYENIDKYLEWTHLGYLYMENLK